MLLFFVSLGFPLNQASAEDPADRPWDRPAGYRLYRRVYRGDRALGNRTAGHRA